VSRVGFGREKEARKWFIDPRNQTVTLPRMMPRLLPHAAAAAGPVTGLLLGGCASPAPAGAAPEPVAAAAAPARVNPPERSGDPKSRS
jgi:hypothetical protein